MAAGSNQARDGAVARLLDRALNRDSSDTVMFARLIGAKIASDELLHPGLTRAALDALLSRHFSHVALPHAAPEPIAASEHRAFVDAMHAMLLQHESSLAATDDDAQCLATIIATACLRPDHLWRDLGLDGRDDVTAILTRHYPRLVARNTDGMRWKKFLARELALAEGRAPAPAPGCPGCEDYGFCYPPG
ncbi:nitrogen fixation protein NifQ [Paraburkholderia sp. Tr-20389]|uniref:nitrogen fixation protein NifQ n=1 Tax=Paraburkholderia sp. Tr-20389 TaxID=2703903 RepID=UPI0019802D78|nr:nitrogen fixation protein NifQ [Paraburkholderia sp. Tr-20389]MBN3754505.1 nitrogen fixation protein NifQ [Paraburkholderia sp. Tr-20389]